MPYSISRFILYHSCRLLFIKQIKGLENIPKGGCIITSNHVSYLDPPIIGSIVAENQKTKIHYVAKRELFKPFFLGALHRYYEAIPLDRIKRDKSWIKTAKKYLKKGHVIGIFPEGERSADNKLGKGKTGVIRLALAAKVLIVPIGIIGTFDLWPRNKKFPRIKRIVKINIGKPLYYNKYYSRKVTKSLLRRLTDDLMREIGKLTRK